MCLAEEVIQEGGEKLRCQDGELMCPEMVALQLIHLDVGSSDSKALGCKVIDGASILKSRLLSYYAHVCPH